MAVVRSSRSRTRATAALVLVCRALPAHGRGRRDQIAHLASVGAKCANATGEGANLAVGGVSIRVFRTAVVSPRGVTQVLSGVTSPYDDNIETGSRCIDIDATVLIRNGEGLTVRAGYVGDEDIEFESIALLGIDTDQLQPIIPVLQRFLG